LHFSLFLQNKSKLMIMKSCTIDHIALYADDLEAMKDFFLRYFQATANELYHNPKTGFSSYFLSFGGDARLEIMHASGMRHPRKAMKQAGYTHLSFRTGGREQVDRLTKQLVDGGFELLSGPRTTGDGYYESSILGPEGNQIEITE